MLKSSTAWRLLIADRDIGCGYTIAKMLYGILDGTLHSYQHAFTPAGAAHRIAQDKPHLVVIADRFPYNVSAFDVLRDCNVGDRQTLRVRVGRGENVAMPTFQTLIISNSVDTLLAREAESYGVLACLEKPVQETALREAMRKFLRWQSVYSQFSASSLTAILGYGKDEQPQETASNATFDEEDMPFYFDPHNVAEMLHNGKESRARTEIELVLKIGRDHVKVRVTDIVRCEADDNYVLVHLATGVTHRTRGKLSDYTNRLIPYGFVPVHRSHLIQVGAVRQFNVEFLAVNGTIAAIPISETYREAFFASFQSGKNG